MKTFSSLTKHAFLSAAALVCLSAAANAADYVATVAADNPISNFRLTTPTTGSSVGGYTTTYSATTGTGAGAPIAADPTNTGATFAGSNAAPSEIDTSLSGRIAGTGSINVWVNLAALPSTLGQIEYIAGESQFGNDFDFQINGNNTLAFYTGAGENTSYQLPSGFTTGTWYMLTATYDATLGANSYRDIYINGAEVASYTGGVNGASKSNEFTIGYSNVFGGRDFDGSIDEVSVFNYGLSASQVTDLYTSAGVLSAVPEPATWAMLLLGFFGIGFMMRGARRKDAVTLA